MHVPSNLLLFRTIFIYIPVNKLKSISCHCFTKGFLAQCDTMEGNISQEIDKLHSKNLALAK